MSNINYKLRSRRGNVHAPFKSPLPAKQDSNSVRDVTTFFQHIEDAKKQCAQLDEEIQSLMSE